jgi:hypothetical protein
MQGNMGEAECLAPARRKWLRQESGDGVRTLPLSFLMFEIVMLNAPTVV